MSKLRCGTCIFLNKRANKDRKTCYTLGKTKGNPACKHWEPDLENFSENVKSLVSLVGLCASKDIPVISWLLKRHQLLLDNKIPYRIGSYILYNRENQWHKIFIENITTTSIIGRDAEGINFVLPLNSDLGTFLGVGL